MTIERLSQTELASCDAYDHHEAVYRIIDEPSQLHAFIAIHKKINGISIGGTRFLTYKTEADALKDALRLSQAMTKKCICAQIDLGGAKAVIMLPEGSFDRSILLQAYARAVSSLEGAFYTGEDVGMSFDDVQYLLTLSPYFVGKKGQAEDPSPYAALSTFIAMKAAVKEVYGSESLAHKHIAIKGAGKVGKELARLCYAEGAKITVADISDEAVQNLKKELPDINIASSDTIHTLTTDVYAPCALGDEFTEKNKHEIKTKIICGSANNQLQHLSISHWFRMNGIVYIPDYIANAGGLIAVADELAPDGFSEKRVKRKIESIGDTVRLFIKNSHNP